MDDGLLPDADRRHAVSTHGPLSPSHIVLHFTQMGSVRSSVDVLNARGFGYHVLIDRDGTIYQTAPFDRLVHHAGASNWRGREALNTFALGVSLANHGPLECGDAGWTAADGTALAEPCVVVASHGNGDPAYADIGWERFPAPQVAAALAVCRQVVEAYDIEEIVRHDDVSIGRKLDTGPALDMAPFRALAADRTVRGHRRRVANGGATLRSTHAQHGCETGRLDGGETVHVLSRSYREHEEGASFDGWCLVSRDGRERAGFVAVADLEAIDPMA